MKFIPREFIQFYSYDSLNKLETYYSQQAVATASAFSDRLCIASKGTIVRNLSAEDLSCCHFCGHKCEGGSPELAWRYLMTDGIVTGGSYQSKEVKY